MKRRTLPAVVLAGTGAVLAAAGLAIGAGGGDRSADIVRQIDPSKPKNVILLVGDGMGDSEVTLARYYGKGAEGRLRMDELPFRGVSIHYVLSAGPGPEYAPNYVGDSAPTATAWSTGKRTIDGRLSQGPSSAANVPGDNASYKTTLEIARERGMKTGNVSTAEITDATPAAPTSHISQRACQGPDNARAICPTETKAAGGLGSIAEQQVDHEVDVTLGGGRARYEQPLEAGGTETVVDYAEGKGFQYVSDAAGLDGVTSADEPVLGLFSSGNMTTEFAELQAAPKPGAGSPDTRCTEGNRPADQPSLTGMTTKAISLLDDDPDGFFLQVEGASIDKRDHATDVCGQIGETLEFDKAVGAAIDYQKSHPDTLVLVTADHAHSSQMTYATQETVGEYATLKTVDGAPIRVTYGTQSAFGSDATHSGATVPVFAGGPQAANVLGTLDETDLFGIVLGKKPSKLPGTTPRKPVVSAAVQPSVSRYRLASGRLQVALALTDATTVRLRLTQDGRTLWSERLTDPDDAQTVRVQPRRSARIRRGPATLTVKARGPGGATTSTQIIRIR